MPQRLLPDVAELFAVLELQPWSGGPYNAERPDANMRLYPFG